MQGGEVSYFGDLEELGGTLDDLIVVVLQGLVVVLTFRCALLVFHLWRLSLQWLRDLMLRQKLNLLKLDWFLHCASCFQSLF